MRITRVLGFALLTAAAGFAVGQTAPRLDSSPVTLATLPLKLPAVGHLEAVDEWRFGRVQRIERRTGSADILFVSDLVACEQTGTRRLPPPSFPCTTVTPLPRKSSSSRLRLTGIDGDRPSPAPRRRPGGPGGPLGQGC